MNVFVVRPGSGQTLWPQTQITTTTFGNSSNNTKFAMQTSQVAGYQVLPGPSHSKKKMNAKAEQSVESARKCADLHVAWPWTLTATKLEVTLMLISSGG